MSIPGSASPLFLSAAAAAAPTGYQIDRSVRLNSADSAYFSRTPSSAGNRKTWTWSGWIKRSTVTGTQNFFSTNPASGETNTNSFRLRFTSGNTLAVLHTSSYSIITSQVFRDPSSWFHVVLALDTTQLTASDRLKLYINGELVTSYGTDNRSTVITQNSDQGINLAQEHRIGNDQDATSEFFDGYLADVHFVDGQALAASDFGEYDANNVWQPKAYSGSYGTNGFRLDFSDNSSNAALGYDAAGSNDWTVNNLVAEQPTTLPAVAFDGGDNTNLSIADSADFDHASAFTWEGYFYLRSYDSSGSSIVRHEDDGLDWYINTSGNILFNQNPSANLVNSGNNVMTLNEWVHIAVSHTGSVCKMFVNGIEKASATTTTVPDNVSGTLYIGETGDNNSYQWNGLISNLRFVNGTALYTANFTPPTAPLTNVTNTKLLCCQSSSSATAATVSPGTITANGNAFATEFSDSTSANDSLIDTPTNYEAASGNNGGNYATFNPLSIKANQGTMENGNLKISATSNHYIEGRSTIAASSFDNYSELTISSVSSNPSMGFAVGDKDAWIITGGGAYLVYRESGTIIRYPGNTTVATVASYTQGDVLGMAVDNTNVKFYKNGSLQGTYAHQLTGEYFVTAMTVNGNVPGQYTTLDVNFGQRPFAISSVPTGYKSLCTQNLPDPTIADGSTAMDAKLYTGNGSTQTISGLGFSPDLVWLKVRNTTYSHYLSDTVRGATKELYTNATNAEGTDANGLTAFTSDGFTLGTDVGRNESAKTYVAWTWDAGTSTVSNTDGSITSSVRANASAGFSIVSYTGTGSAGTVGHGLNADMGMVITKTRESANGWIVWHSSFSNLTNNYLQLNLTDAVGTLSNYWGSGGVTNSVFGLGTYTGNNTSGEGMIAYCFAPVEGYSAFGSYEGTGGSPVFVYTGFRPAFVLYKNADAAAGWQIYDSTRDPFNQCDARLQTNSSGAEDTEAAIDIVSNGFVQRASHARSNASGNTYIYAAFAEHPFKYSRAR